MAHRTEPDHVRITKEGGTTYIRVPIILFGGLVVVMFLLGFLFWSAKWRRDTHQLAVSQPGDLEALLPSIVNLTQGTLTTGNRVEITQNGDGFFPLLFRDIASARDHIHIETYIWWDGRLARQLAGLLAQKARQGVVVRVLVDGSGGRQISKVQDQLEQAGVKVAKFHPPRFSNLGRMNNRDHRKIMIVDGRIAHVGGYGIADEWMGNAQDKKHWRDTGLRLEGPLVNQLQGAFCENWIEETGQVIAGARYFPPPQQPGATSAHAAYTSPSGSVSSVQVLYYLAFKAARREIIVQNPYLLPERDAVEAMEEAVRRGVRVWIMVPSASATDSPIVQHASHHRFGNLLKRGIRIWEYDRTLLHQKVMVVDGLWSSVGSTNFDARSFELNDEVTVGVIDRQIAAQLKQAFLADLRHARERRYEEWRKRSLWHKLQDGLAYLAHEQL